MLGVSHLDQCRGALLDAATHLTINGIFAGLRNTGWAGGFPRRKRELALTPERRACQMRSRNPATGSRTQTEQAQTRIGSRRTGTPVAAETALATAGAMGGVPASPTPPGAAELSIRRTWIAGEDASVGTR